jgi:hypothetical protein
MDIVILTTFILAGVILESFISERARRRAGMDDTVTDRLARYADRDLY